jgi:hypothetical protein
VPSLALHGKPALALHRHIQVAARGISGPGEKSEPVVVSTVNTRVPACSPVVGTARKPTVSARKPVVLALARLCAKVACRSSRYLAPVIAV